MKTKKRRKTKKEYLGFDMHLFIYNPKRSLTWDDVDEFVDEVIELIEKRKWCAGGGWKMADINGEDRSWIEITPKHIKTFNRVSEKSKNTKNNQKSS